MGKLEEGQKMRDWLREHVSELRFCYFHRWRPKDLVMWDNRCLLHRAGRKGVGAVALVSPTVSLLAGSSLSEERGR